MRFNSQNIFNLGRLFSWVTANFSGKSLAFTLGVYYVSRIWVVTFFLLFFFQVLCIWVSRILDLFGGGEVERVGGVIRWGVV